MSRILYLTADQVLRLHRDAIEEFGGRDGVRSEHALFSAIFQPQQSAFGEDGYQTVPEKAAAYGFFLCQSHPFVDGNKRAGLMAMEVFLEINGYGFDQTDDQIIERFLGVASGNVRQDEFFRWVSAYARSGPRIVDSVLSEISTGFQAAVFTVTCSKYTASGVRRSSAV